MDVFLQATQRGTATQRFRKEVLDHVTFVEAVPLSQQALSLLLSKHLAREELVHVSCIGRPVSRDHVDQTSTSAPCLSGQRLQPLLEKQSELCQKLALMSSVQMLEV